MLQLSTFYTSPTDPAAFDSHYSTVHLEILSRLPGLRHATINWPRGEPAPYHAVTLLYWDDRGSALSALAGPVGQEVAAQNFSDAGSFTMFATSTAMIPFTRSDPRAEICGVLGLYERPSNETAFRAHYEETHSLLAAAMPRQRAFTVSWTTHEPDAEPPPYHLIGNQEWETQEDFEFCLASPEAAAAIADLDTFVDSSMTILSCRTLVV